MLAEKDALLILDEAEARAVAEVLSCTGTIGLLIYACEEGRMFRRGSRMTVALYDWALVMLKACRGDDVLPIGLGKPGW